MPPKNLPPQNLAGLKKAQIVTVAQNGYNLGLNSACKIDQLRDDLARRMTTILQCDNEGCGGGQCDPAVHVFAPEFYAPASAGRDNLEALLSTSTTQQDAPIDVESGSPGAVVNPPADVAAQRRAVAEAALAAVGPSLEEAANLDVVLLDGATGGSDRTETGTKRKTGNVFRSRE